LLELKNLHAGYGQGDVLQGLSLKVAEQEVVCLLGRNGAGKSTTLKSIMQLVRPRQGTISLFGQELVGMPTHKVALAGVGYVPEDRRIFPRLTVEENLRVTRTGAHRRDAWSLERIYQAFPVLRQRRTQLGGTLSGGEQQMLAIARTLAAGPTLLLLDEPSEGLAPLMVRELIRQIGLLKEQRLTILLSEQNLSFADGLSDRVYVIDKGMIQFEGRFSDLKQNAELQQRYLSLGVKPARYGAPAD
jgi:branched-chain amino acid transport system ATP-binding protein